jgi:DNA repair protein RadC
MSIQKWPEQERPREKLLAHGAEHLSTAELLAILLSTGTRGKTALDLARELIVKHRTLRKLLHLNHQDFIQQPGMGTAKYCQLQAASELGRRYLKESMEQRQVISKAKDVKNFLIARLRDLEQEVFACLYLDNQHRILHFEKLFHGSIRSTPIYPREVVKRALFHNAAALIVAHNHPSGAAEPSAADHAITARLQKALDLIDVKLLDHIIVADNQTVSFAEQGLLVAH